MLPELPERDARGRAAEIYAEIRTLCAVPYVSSMQRHLATRPGWLEWAWTVVRPAFACGAAQEAAWRLVADLDVPPLAPVSRPALRVLGVDAAGEAAIHAACESFVRAPPTNLVLSGLLRRLLTGARPGGRGFATSDWRPPPPLPAPPSLVDPERLSDDARAVLMQLATEVAGRPFVPGLYRMLAHWPAWLAHVATVLAPRLEDPHTRARCAGLAERIDAVVPDLLARLPALPRDPPAPPRGEHAEVLAALETYRGTSPQLVVFASLVRDALPSPEPA